jgi:hypothetical protein
MEVAMEVEAAPTEAVMEPAEVAEVMEVILASGVEVEEVEVALEETEDATTAERTVTWQETALLRLKEDPATSAIRLDTSPATVPQPPKPGVSVGSFTVGKPTTW